MPQTPVIQVMAFTDDLSQILSAWEVMQQLWSPVINVSLILKNLKNNFEEMKKRLAIYYFFFLYVRIT